MPSPFYLFILVSAYASVGENRILGWTEVGGKKTDVGGNMDKTKMIPAYYYYHHIFFESRTCHRHSAFPGYPHACFCCLVDDDIAGIILYGVIKPHPKKETHFEFVNVL